MEFLEVVEIPYYGEHRMALQSCAGTATFQLLANSAAGNLKREI